MGIIGVLVIYMGGFVKAKLDSDEGTIRRILANWQGKACLGNAGVLSAVYCVRRNGIIGKQVSLRYQVMRAITYT